MQENQAPINEVPALDKYHEIELQKLLEGLLSTQTLRVQAGIFFGTVNFGAIGIAFTQQNAGIILLATVLIGGFLLIDYVAKRNLTFLLYRVIQLRKRYAPQDNNSFFPLAGLPWRIDREITRIIEIPNQEEQIKEILSLPLNRVTFGSHGLRRSYASIISFWIPIGICIIEVILGLIMWLVFGWVLF